MTKSILEELFSQCAENREILPSEEYKKCLDVCADLFKTGVKFGVLFAFEVLNN